MNIPSIFLSTSYRQPFGDVKLLQIQIQPERICEMMRVREELNPFLAREL
jgi:hypothetical protein